MYAEDYIESLAERGQYHFTTESVKEAVNANDAAVRAQLRRLRERGKIATPFRTFQVIIMPEHRLMGCVPAEYFIHHLMRFLGEPYYLCLLSAAERHGAAHQRPQMTQVMVRKNRPDIECGMVHVKFIARSEVAEMPSVLLPGPRGMLCYSTPEVTALELVGHPSYGGGLDNIATVLSELTEAMDPERLLHASSINPIGWSQRLGYLLELVGANQLASVLEEPVNAAAHSYIPLRRSDSVAGASRSAKWKLIINADVEPDL
jgi:predicted transcriptional regulator of viral defense system